VAGLVRPIGECFGLDWPHAIGGDDKGALIWEGSLDGKPMSTWMEALHFFAQLRRSLRAAAATIGGSGGVSASQIVGYPAGRGTGGAWRNSDRLSNGIRFKLSRRGDRLVPVAVHLPSGLPAPLAAKLSAADNAWVSKNLGDIWSAVHRVLDSNMKRAGTEK
jgi:CRISPR-associated protein Cmr1